MNLSLQSTCIIFAVTFVHVVVIAALSPLPKSGAELRQPDTVSGAAEPAFELSAFDPSPADEVIIDLPAVRRPPVADSVSAESGTAGAGASNPSTISRF